MPLLMPQSAAHHPTLPAQGAHRLSVSPQGAQGCRTLAASPGCVVLLALRWPLGACVRSMEGGAASHPSQCGCGPAPEPSDPQGRECQRLLQQLQRSSQQLWEVTEKSLYSLRERLRHPDAMGLESVLLLCGPDYVLQAHME